jgi:hypothetical protein
MSGLQTFQELLGGFSRKLLGIPLSGGRFFQKNFCGRVAESGIGALNCEVGEIEPAKLVAVPLKKLVKTHCSQSASCISS